MGWFSKNFPTVARLAGRLTGGRGQRRPVSRGASRGRTPRQAAASDIQVPASDGVDLLKQMADPSNAPPSVLGEPGIGIEATLPTTVEGRPEVDFADLPPEIAEILGAVAAAPAQSPTADSSLIGPPTIGVPAEAAAEPEKEWAPFEPVPEPSPGATGQPGPIPAESAPHIAGPDFVPHETEPQPRPSTPEYRAESTSMAQMYDTWVEL